MRLMRRILFAAAWLALAGCATGMSKKECLYADWRAIGYEDGARGAPVSAISSRRAACAEKAALAPDMSAYLAGREEGLDQFCRPARAFDLGAHGGRYAGACAGRDESAFLAAFAQGRGLFERQSAANAAANALAAAESDLDRLDHQITKAEAALIAPSTATQERVRLLADLKQMREDRARLRRALPGLRRDLALAERDLDAYKQSFADNAPYAALTPTPASY
ncbi:MAG: DUF2799 domain-containing protein [Alphaproteobacteria bacterium]|nr:DUF2799 domain-containing protein [Alphaproteobacteria bacterium]